MVILANETISERITGKSEAIPLRRESVPAHLILGLNILDGLGDMHEGSGSV